jgi:hypothetical protein
VAAQAPFSIRFPRRPQASCFNLYPPAPVFSLLYFSAPQLLSTNYDSNSDVLLLCFLVLSWFHRCTFKLFVYLAKPHIIFEIRHLHGLPQRDVKSTQSTELTSWCKRKEDVHLVDPANATPLNVARRTHPLSHCSWKQINLHTCHNING